MWASSTDITSDGVHRVRLFENNHELTFREITSLLQHDAGFRTWFSDELTRVPMQAFFWEIRPVTHSTFDTAFEYVLISAPSLALQTADPSAFGNQFDTATSDVVHFENLGGDATLIAPLPVCDRTDYTHLHGFLRTAPKAQINRVWRIVFGLVVEKLSNTPIWVSTSGLGIPWLHIRLDSVPKYYNYVSYKNPR